MREKELFFRFYLISNPTAPAVAERYHDRRSDAIKMNEKTLLETLTAPVTSVVYKCIFSNSFHFDLPSPTEKKT